MTRYYDRPELDQRGRPVLVWFIAGWYCWGLIAGGFSLALAAANVLPMLPAQKRYFESLTAFDYACTAAVLVLNLVAAIALFAMRRFALPLFVIALVSGFASTVYQLVAKDWLAALGPMAPAALVGTVIGWGISVAVIFYTRSLARRGVLR